MRHEAAAEWPEQVTKMNESNPNTSPATEPKIPGESEPTHAPGSLGDESRPLLDDDDQAEELEELEPEEPVGTPASNQQVA